LRVSGRGAITTHDRIQAEEDVVVASPRSFGLVFATVLAVYGAVGPWLRHQPLRSWALIAAAVLLVAATVAPRTLNPAAALWQRFGLLMHRVVNPVVMAALYYVALTPCAFIMRTFSTGWSDRLRIDRAARTYWIDRDCPPSSMTRQF
jgi:hypothetical protein